MNKAILEGFAGRDAEIRYIPNGKAVISFSLATSNDYKDKSSGEWVKRPADWHNIVVYGDNETAANVKKGDKIKVEGRISYRSWEKDGIKRNTTEIIGWEVTTNEEKDNRPLPLPEYDDDQIPF